jgi:hypothetical protein
MVFWQHTFQLSSQDIINLLEQLLRYSLQLHANWGGLPTDQHANISLKDKVPTVHYAN